jgi:hypothetical protein
MDKDMTLVADEGMRILSPNYKTKCPYFIASNDDLWEAWCEIQRRGTGEEGDWFRKGWRINTKHLPNGSSIMTLEIRFDPTDDSKTVSNQT